MAFAQAKAHPGGLTGLKWDLSDCPSKMTKIEVRSPFTNEEIETLRAARSMLVKYGYIKPEQVECSEAPCFECGQPAFHNHHVVPRSLGGMATVPLCEKCHGIVHERGGMVGHGVLTRLGIARAKAEGKRLGRPRKFNRPEPEIVIQLRAQNLSWREIADELGCSSSSARRAAGLDGG